MRTLAHEAPVEGLRQAVLVCVDERGVGRRLVNGFVRYECDVQPFLCKKPLCPLAIILCRFVRTSCVAAWPPLTKTS